MLSSVIAGVGGETGLQWLPLQVPGNVRIIVTATHPDPNYLQLHEQKIRQHMVNPHEALPVSPPPGISSGERGAPSSNSGGSGSVGRGQKSTETAEEGEAEYESSHRRRKARNFKIETDERCQTNISMRSTVRRGLDQPDLGNTRQQPTPKL